MLVAVVGVDPGLGARAERRRVAAAGRPRRLRRRRLRARAVLPGPGGARVDPAHAVGHAADVGDDARRRGAGPAPAGGVTARETPRCSPSAAATSSRTRLFAFASSRGQVSIASVLGSLYPVVTIVLARLVLGERLRRVQQVGVALAVGGAAVTAADRTRCRPRAAPAGMGGCRLVTTPDATTPAPDRPPLPATPRAPPPPTPPWCAPPAGSRVPHTPVWFMRQAGRSLPEYREVREGVGMLESCRAPGPRHRDHPAAGAPARRRRRDLLLRHRRAARGHRRRPRHRRRASGRSSPRPIRTRADLDQLRDLTPDDVPDITESVRLLIAELGATPLIGFAGAPFTSRPTSSRAGRRRTTSTPRR